MTGAPGLDSAAATHVGSVRRENEDSVLAAPDAGLWLVADGMGGHANGRFASQTIVDVVAGARLPDGLDDACAAVAAAVRDANARILARAREAGSQMGSTFVALVVRGAAFGVLWAGDSRAYLRHGGALTRLTRDHSQVEEMVERGLLTAEAALTHAMRHVLSRAVGVQDTLEIASVRGTLAAGDTLLLCSDGLHGVVDDGGIAEILGAGVGAAATGEALVAASLASGAPDNVTVALVRVAGQSL